MTKTSSNTQTVFRILAVFVLLNIVCGVLLVLGRHFYTEKYSLDNDLPSVNQVVLTESDAFATAAAYRQHEIDVSAASSTQSARTAVQQRKATGTTIVLLGQAATSTSEAKSAQQRTATEQSQIAAQATHTKSALLDESVAATVTVRNRQDATATAIAIEKVQTTSTALAALHQMATSTAVAERRKKATATARSKPVTGRVISNILNIRPGPGTEYYPPVGELKRGDTVYIIGRNQASDGSVWWQIQRENGWIHSAFVDESGCLECVPKAALPPTPTPRPTKKPPKPTPTSQSSKQWVLVADSFIDYPGPIIDRRWWYLWSSGRNNFYWQDMAGGQPDQCYESPNDWNLVICRDHIVTDPAGDVSILWKYGQSGTYRFEWDSSALKFYRHLNYIGSQRPGSKLRYSATFRNVNQWELFFWVATQDTEYHIKVYRLQE